MLGDDGAKQVEATALRQKQQQQLEAEIQSILGEENYARFHALLRQSDFNSFRSRIEPLATRLSYTNSPLTAGTIDQLHSLLIQLNIPAHSDRAVLAEPVVQAARTILNPELHAALRQLQTEMRAKDKRAQLPKSSEIPRQ